MKKYFLIPLLIILLVFCSCAPAKESQVVATTKPIYEFTSYLCQDTEILVDLLVTEDISCLHDYSLQVWQMRALESAQMVILNGAGLESFMEDLPTLKAHYIDCSTGVSLICPEDNHHHDEDHHHDADPHFWLDIASAKIMVENICDGLTAEYPQHKEKFTKNKKALIEELNALYEYGKAALKNIKNREMITFHDGFAYFAECFDLTILAAVEEESGAEASAAELIDLIKIVNAHSLPAVFTEASGSTSAAQIIAAETGACIYSLDMCMSESSYFDAMYHNINTVKEALK